MYQCFPTSAARWHDLEVLLTLPKPHPYPSPTQSLRRRESGHKYHDKPGAPNVQEGGLTAPGPGSGPSGFLALQLTRPPQCSLSPFLWPFKLLGLRKESFHNNLVF